jgi:hypothetical protein
MTAASVISTVAPGRFSVCLKEKEMFKPIVAAIAAMLLGCGVAQR